MASPIDGGYGNIRPDRGTRQPLENEARGGTGVPAGDNAGKRVQAGDDQVSLTRDAERIRNMEGQLAQEPAIDQAKVDRIKEMISSGEYSVDPDKVAEKFIALELSAGLR